MGTNMYNCFTLQNSTQRLVLGASDIDKRLKVHLVDRIIYSFQEQGTEDQVMLDGFGTVFNALGICVKPYLTQIVSTILWRLNNKSAKVFVSWFLLYRNVRY